MHVGQCDTIMISDHIAIYHLPLLTLLWWTVLVLRLRYSYWLTVHNSQCLTSNLVLIVAISHFANRTSRMPSQLNLLLLRILYFVWHWDDNVWLLLNVFFFAKLIENRNEKNLFQCHLFLILCSGCWCWFLQLFTF